MTRGRDPRGAPDDGLNLVPVMNLIVCLIPVVLAGTSLVNVGVIEVDPPALCAVDCLPDDTHVRPLNLTIAVDEVGFRLDAQGADLATLLEAPGPVIARGADGEPDYVALYNALAVIKSHYPQESSFTLTAAADVPYASVVAVMDLARVKLDAPRFDSLAALRAAKVARTGTGHPELLMPDVALAVVR